MPSWQEALRVTGLSRKPYRAFPLHLAGRLVKRSKRSVLTAVTRLSKRPPFYSRPAATRGYEPMSGKGRRSCKVHIKISLLAIAYLEVRRCQFQTCGKTGTRPVWTSRRLMRRQSGSGPTPGAEWYVRAGRCSFGRPACLAAAPLRRRWLRTRATSSAKQCAPESASFGGRAGASLTAGDRMSQSISDDGG